MPFEALHVRMHQSDTATTREARPPSVAAESYRRAGEQQAGRPPDPLRSLRPLGILAGTVLVAVILYFGRAVLIPLALAGLLAFLLSPLVDTLQRWRVGRFTSVLIVVVVLFSLLAGFAWTLAVQVASLGEELPKYRGNIRAKIADLRGARRDTAIDKLEKEARDVLGEIQKDDQPSGERRQPVPVTIQDPFLRRRLPILLEVLASAGLVIVLVVFMLVRREELRNRIIRLAGYGRLPAATRALDEAAQRVSRYLLTQSMVNGGFGAAVGLGLFFIGLPYAFLWGFLAACLRFIPYVGTWMAALLPITLSLAVFQGWPRPLLVVALFLVLEPFIYLVLEPLVYGQSAGVSEIALLVAVAFWTWIWGPVGLIMAVPLTVCLVVFAKHVPALEFIIVLMGDEPVMEAKVSFYQRLLAGDQDEAMDLVDGALKERPREQVYDELIVPALGYARGDHARGRLDDSEEREVVTAVRDIVEYLEAGERRRDVPAEEPPCVVGCPVQGDADAVTLAMLEVLTAGRCRMEIVPAGLLTAEIAQIVERSGARAVCLAALPPGGLSRTRYLCKRLRARWPDLRILIMRWTGASGDENPEPLVAAGADSIHTTLLQTRDEISRLAETPPTSSPPPVLASPGRVREVA
jgi:predicted PurR-regulated permease PerM